MVESGIDMTSPNSEHNLAPHSPIYDDTSTQTTASFSQMEPPTHQIYTKNAMEKSTHPMENFSHRSENSMDKATSPMENYSPMEYSTEKDLCEFTDKLMEDIPEEELTPSPITPVFKSKAPHLSLEMNKSMNQSIDSTDGLSESQIWERDVMKQLEEEAEDGTCCETMQELLEKEGIQSPPIATEIQIEKYIIAKHAVRPDLLRGVDHVIHEDSYSDQESIEITAKDYSSRKDPEPTFGQAIAPEKQSRDSGFCKSDATALATTLDYSPSDTSSFSMAVISNDDGQPDTEEEESDLPLDTPEQKDLPILGAEDEILETKTKSHMLNTTYCIEEETEDELITGGGEELAQPDVVTAEFTPIPKNGLFVVNPMEMEKIAKDLSEVEDCMNRTKDFTNADDYIQNTVNFNETNEDYVLNEQNTQRSKDVGLAEAVNDCTTDLDGDIVESQNSDMNDMNSAKGAGLDIPKHQGIPRKQIPNPNYVNVNTGANINIPKQQVIPKKAHTLPDRNVEPPRQLLQPRSHTFPSERNSEPARKLSQPLPVAVRNGEPTRKISEPQMLPGKNTEFARQVSEPTRKLSEPPTRNMEIARQVSAPSTRNTEFTRQVSKPASKNTEFARQVSEPAARKLSEPQTSAARNTEFSRQVSEPASTNVNGTNRGGQTSKLPGAYSSTSAPRPTSLPSRSGGIPRPAGIPRPSFTKGNKGGASTVPPPSRLPGLGIQRVNKAGVQLRSFAGVVQK